MTLHFANYCNPTVKQGSIVDASLVKSHYRASVAGARRDTDATWTVKQERPHYGYKAHVSVDKDSELIRKLEITPALVHDSQVFEELVVGDEEEVVYALRPCVIKEAIIYICT